MNYHVNLPKTDCSNVKLRQIVMALIVCTICSSITLSAQTLKLQVDAGAFDRQHTVVQVHLPLYMKAGVYSLTSKDGSIQPFQVDQSNTGWFILDSLDAGSATIYELDISSLQKDERVSTVDELGPNLWSSSVSVQKDESTLNLLTQNSPVLSYYNGNNSPPDELDGRYTRGGYIHPVYSPSGLVLTNHLNVDQHPHHAGIWSAWTNTIFEGRNPDFWNVHRNSGRVDVDSLLYYWEGPVSGGLASRHKFTDLSGDSHVIALNEVWEVNVYSVPANVGYHIFDIVVTQTVNTDKPLILPEYRYGGIGFRGHIDWDDPEKSDFLTAEGLARDGHATRSRWVHMGGYVQDERAGFAILGHPSNYRFPQPLRIHPSEPFFNFAPTQMGDMEIAPGIPLVTKLRIITSDGLPDANLIDRLWNDYAYPPGVTVEIN